MSWWQSEQKLILYGALGVTTTVAIYSTVRLVQEKQRARRDNVYESKKLVNEYLVFHYGAPKEVLKYDFGPKESVDFPKRCADLCLKHIGSGVSNGWLLFLIRLASRSTLV